ncbi:hypothetical protein B932_0117 [Gluconobacter oxydans H24]|nr:hypothetical protein B932_0117 [Gluconobacter oxydans H24]
MDGVAFAAEGRGMNVPMGPVSDGEWGGAAKYPVPAGV